MNYLFVLSILMVSSLALAAPSPYSENSFGLMPHKDIMRLNKEACEVEGNATGDSASVEECIEYQEKAYEKLVDIYNRHNITAPSWSLCIAQSHIHPSYNYVIMLGCMKVVKDICKETKDGKWENPNLCMKSIESGSWINNPKVYQPYKPD
ncbi:hypothetical protein R4446_16330 [Acinetobacter baumannii]|nr:hypothetical protein [Acinetobacter baumannii]MDV7408372.1 hypothetical protein [Acinetobacter baumannii]